MTSRLEALVTQIESMDPDESSDSIEALLAVLEEAAQLGDGQEILVSRFARSSNVVLLRSLSFVLSRRGDLRERINLEALLDLAANIESDDISTLINILSGLQRNRMNPAVDELLRAKHASLEHLVQLSLDHSSTLVNTSALHYLEQLHEDGQFHAVLNDASVLYVIRTLTHWRDSEDRDIAQDAHMLLSMIAQS